MSVWSFRRFLVILIVLSLVERASCTSISVITFDELPEQRLDGVSLSGVTFFHESGGAGFPVALFGTDHFEFAQSNLISVPSVAGSAGNPLRLFFDTSINYLSFNVGFTGFSEMDTFQVNLFNGGDLIDSAIIPMFLAGDEPFSLNENQYAFSDPAQSVNSAVITFNSLGADNFVFDDLAFGSIPEPFSISLLMSGFLVFLRRKRSFLMS